MNDYFIHCDFTGEDFSPSKFFEDLAGFEIISMNDSGGKELIGRDVLGTLTFGSLTISPQKKSAEDFDVLFYKFLKDLITLKNRFAGINLTTVVHLDLGYETQCNFELRADEIGLLNSLKATFTITCYQK